jgi:hypothetical protein
MQGNLQGVEVDRTASLKALAISVAAAAGHPESDDDAPDGTDPAARTAAGGSDFKLVARW